MLSFRYFLVGLLSFIGWEGCSTSTATNSSQKIVAKVSEVLLDLREGHNELTFFLYLERSDLGLKEPLVHGLVVDLPSPLKPQWIMVTSDDRRRDPEQGSTCDAARFPHKCTIGLSGNLVDSRQKVFLKVAFEDGYEGVGETVVPRPPVLARPEILEPSTPPQQGSPLKIRFKDVGAHTYDIGVQFCGHTQGGINPCLGGIEYFLERRGEKLIFPQSYPRFPPRLTINAGVITLQSDLPVRFDSEFKVSVEAGQVTKSQEGIRMVMRSHFTRSLH